MHNNQRQLISHSAAYMRRWIGSAQLQIMVCCLFGTKPLSEQTFRYSQELSPGPSVYSDILIKIENFSFTEMHLNVSSVKWQPFCQWGDGLTKRELTMLSDHRNAFSILMFGLIFTSFIGTFYRWPQWHWIKYLNIIDVMVWFLLATIIWAKGNQYFICCYEATMNSSASAWSV